MVMSRRGAVGLLLAVCEWPLAAQTIPPAPPASSAPPASPAWVAQAKQVVVYPRAEQADDRRDDYPLALLALALAKTRKAYELRPHPVFMLQVRAISELEHGRSVDVIWTMTSAEREKVLLPVRIPVDRGLMGWRLLMVRQKSLPQFAALTSADGLKQLRGGLGFDWPDAAILRHSGFTVDESVRYGDIFLKLANDRIDYFSRSVQEVWGELETHVEADFTIEPTFALHYPAAMYFFVNRRNTALATDIQRGLELALADGSFEALFQQHFGALLKRAELGRRRVVELPNPLLPADTPLQDRRLWYRPGR